MGHYDRQAWIDFVSDCPVDRDAMERHLAACDDCLTIYLETVERMADKLPDISDPLTLWVESAFPEFPPPVEHAALAATELHPQNRREGFSDNKHSWVSHPWFHYAVAACITLMLTSSGLFTQVIRQVTALSDQISVRDESELTTTIMEETSIWINDLASGKKGSVDK